MTKVVAAQILDEGSDKPNVGWVGLLDVKKDNNGGSVAGDVDEVTFSSRGKNGVGGVRGEEFGCASVLDSGIDNRGVFCDSFNGLDLAAKGVKISNEDDGRRLKGVRTINLNAAAVSSEGNGERLEDRFLFGDIVWGKLKNHPWWPGQVYDPTYASEYALKHRPEGRILVAFYGDGSCGWCLPSQLVPFAQNPGEMCSDDTSKCLLNAVQMASNEISRLMESRILCRCIPSERRGHLARPMACNAGVREGVLVPEVGNDRLPVPEYEPAEILAKVCDFARTGSFDSVFELAVLKSWVSAYYNAKYGSQLQVYSEPCLIEGLEDMSDGDTAVPNLSIVLYQRLKEDSLSSPTISSAKLKKTPSKVKIYRRRKKERIVTPKPRGRSAAKESKDDGKIEKVGRLGVWSTGKRTRKGSGSDTVVVKSDDTEVAPVEANVESEIGSMPRERKRSRYLSPPYTYDHRMRTGFSGCNPEFEEEEITTEDSEDLFASPVPESDDQASVEPNALAAKNKKKLISYVDVKVDDLLQKLATGAVDCWYLREEGHLDSVHGFISAYRGTTYLHGSDNKVHQKCKKVNAKRKASSLASPSRSKPRGPAVASRASQPTDDHLILGARVIGQKVDIMTEMLENHSSRFLSDDRACLELDMGHLLKNLEYLEEKIREMAGNSTTSAHLEWR